MFGKKNDKITDFGYSGWSPKKHEDGGFVYRAWHGDYELFAGGQLESPKTLGFRIAISSNTVDEEILDKKAKELFKVLNVPEEKSGETKTTRSAYLKTRFSSDEDYEKNKLNKVGSFKDFLDI